MSKFDRTPVDPGSLKRGHYFAASYAGEHVAGTEFVIGATFVAWGVSATDVILGLIIGNAIAVLTWALVCGPIATDTRLTLYAYLEKIAGSSFIKVYSLINGLLFCVLAGSMITVSASAVRILFDIPPQVNWYPTSLSFVLVAIGVGAVVSFAAAKGFVFVARFAEVSAPWLISIFFIGAIAPLPVLLAATPGVSGIHGFHDFLTLANQSIWQEQHTKMSIFHVIAIAWGANLAFHGALGDMTILRFARRTSYAWFSAIGMFIGHFGAWLAAGVMGAAAALMLKTSLTMLDAGAVAYQVLGSMGILGVIIAGWTTSNPTLYRAGLAFQSLYPSLSRERVTLVLGLVTTAIACFPFVFTKLLDFLGVMALLMAPTGGIIFCEHYVLRRMGLTRYWNSLRGSSFNLAAGLTWALSLALAGVLYFLFSVHVLFLFIPAWFSGLVVYAMLARFMGAADADRAEAARREEAEHARKAAEQAYLSSSQEKPGLRSRGLRGLRLVIIASLVAGFGAAGYAYATGNLESYKMYLAVSSAIYFVSAIALVVLTWEAEKPEEHDV